MGVAGAWARPQPADEDDWSFNAIFDYIPDGDEVYDTIVESVPKPVVTVAKSFFLANLDKVSEEDAANEQKQIVNLRRKLGELDTAIKAEDHDEIDNEHEQEIQEMIQALRLMFTDPSVDDFWDAMNRAQLHIYRGHEVLLHPQGGRRLRLRGRHQLQLHHHRRLDEGE